MVPDKKPEDHQSFYKSSWRQHECLYQVSQQSACHLLKYFTRNVKTLTCGRCYKKSQGITKVMQMYPLGSMNICTKLDGNTFKSCWDISVWTKVVEHLTYVALSIIPLWVETITFTVVLWEVVCSRLGAEDGGLMSRAVRQSLEKQQNSLWPVTKHL